MQIYKQPLDITSNNNGVTGNAVKFIHVGPDPSGQPCVWYETDTVNVPQSHHPIVIIGTGHTKPRDMVHIGSYIDGPFVWHVYARSWS